MFMFCYFYDDDNDDDDLPNVLTLKIVYQGLEVVRCLGINGWNAMLSVCTVWTIDVLEIICLTAAAQLTEGVTQELLQWKQT